MGMDDIKNSADGGFAGSPTDPGSGSFGTDSAGSPANTGSDSFGGEPSDASSAPPDAPADTGNDTTGSAGNGGGEDLGDKVGDALRGLGDKIKGVFNK